MCKFLRAWSNLKTDRRGVTMLEYAIMGSIIAGALVVAVPFLTEHVGSSFTAIGSNLTSANTTGGTSSGTN
jgi:Flp pilus assembly pilin Flp